jgi:archaellum biogenesis ATPase FlaH
MQVDVTTRMGALGPPTTTGIEPLDRLLTGGLRSDTLLSITGVPGCGKTALALMIAYMAARSRAAVIFASATLDETDVVARLAARAMYREYPESETPYGDIWSGDAWQEDFTRQAVGTSVNVAVHKVGDLLHLFRTRASDSTAEIAAAVAYLSSRHERVVLVVDGMEAFAAAAGGDPGRAAGLNADYSNRISQVSHEFRQMAGNGCAVVVTCQPQSLHLILPAATAGCELTDVTGGSTAYEPRDVALGTRQVVLNLVKNHVGPKAQIPLRFVAGSSVFEVPASEPLL